MFSDAFAFSASIQRNHGGQKHLWNRHRERVTLAPRCIASWAVLIEVRCSIFDNLIAQAATGRRSFSASSAKPVANSPRFQGSLLLANSERLTANSFYRSKVLDFRAPPRMLHANSPACSQPAPCRTQHFCTRSMGPLSAAETHPLAAKGVTCDETRNAGAIVHGARNPRVFCTKPRLHAVQYSEPSGTGSFCGVFAAKCACPPLGGRFWNKLKATCGYASIERTTSPLTSVRR